MSFLVIASCVFAGAVLGGVGVLLIMGDPRMPRSLARVGGLLVVVTMMLGFFLASLLQGILS